VAVRGLLGVVGELFGVQRMSEGRKRVIHLMYTDLGSVDRCGMCKVSLSNSPICFGR
jgi:hypothetical protein